jgi:PhnB protein
MSKPSFVPAGNPVLTPYIMVRDAARAIDWYTQNLGAEEAMRMPMPDGKIAHAEIRFGASVVMLADEGPGYNAPPTIGGTPVMLMLYVKDVDQVYHRALRNGATQVKAIADQFYGDRTATVRDPFGHVWSLATHIEDVSPEEMQKRMEAMSQGAK